MFDFCRKFNVSVETYAYTSSVGIVHAGLLNGTSCKRLVAAFGSGTCSVGCNGGLITNLEESSNDDSSEDGDNISTTSNNGESPDDSDSNSGSSTHAKINSLGHFTSVFLGMFLFKFVLFCHDF